MDKVKGMKLKRVWIFFGLMFFIASVASAGSCLKEAKSLSALQNRIVQRSLQKLSPGAWASYGTVKVVYLGRRVSPKSGKRLDVIEVSGAATGQVWYRIVPRLFPFQGKKLRFLILEPVEAYMKMGGTYFYLTPAMAEIFLKGTRWGTFLNKGMALSPPGCKDLPTIKETTRTLPGGKKVRAYLVRSEKYGGNLTCSPEVPFGLIQAVAPKEKTAVRLVKYGWKGGKGTIPQSALAGAMAITFSLNKEKKESKGKK